ncbi:MAG: ABC transporter permease [Synergistaceae bacterium]|jgi:putative ABC transport system permease protein|nr:ABC transporter permease [Synergistaceae bacterium]
MFFRMLKGALTRRKKRLLMMAFTMALGASMTTAILNVMLDVGDKVGQELRTYGANLTVAPRGASLVSELYGLADVEGEARQQQQKYLAEDDLPKMKMIFWAFNIVDFAPFLEMEAAVRGESVTLVGTWFERRLDLPSGESVETGIKSMRAWWDVEGAWPSDEKGVMAGTELSKRLGLKVGDAIEVESVSMTVTGVFHSGGPEDEHLFVPLGLVQALLGKPGAVSRVDVSALTTPENELARRAARDPDSLSRKEWDTWYCTAYISSIAYQIEEVVTGSRAKPVLRVADSEGEILRKTQLLMLLLTALSLICAALAISSLVTAGVMERSAEIGLLKAIGATGADVFLLLQAENLFASAVGGTVGYFAGLVFAQVVGQTVFGSAIAVKTLVIPITALLVLAVTLLGGAPATRALLALRPAEVLHGRA